MSSEFIIRIPEPCHENWDKMAPSERGRFCNACSKVVVDFTHMDAEATIQYLRENASSKVCGRFTGQQLTFPQSSPQPERGPYQKYFIAPFYRIAAMVITGFTLMLSSCRPSTMGKPEMIPAGRDSSMTIDSSSNVPGDTIVKTPEPVEIPEAKVVEPKIGKVAIEYHTTGLIAIEQLDSLTPDTIKQ